MKAGHGSASSPPSSTRREARHLSRRRASLCRRPLGWCALAAILGCAQEPELRQYDAQVTFESDPEQTVAGAELLLAGQVAGASNLDGVVDLRVAGREGQRFDYQVRCPPGYRAPKQPLAITLTTLSAAAPPPEYRVRCMPEARSVVIAVRAEHGSDLPVTSLGREVARTDASGATHLQLLLARSEPIELTLDTSSRPDLRPQNPSQRFEAPNRDAVLLFDQDFVVVRPRAQQRPRIVQFR